MKRMHFDFFNSVTDSKGCICTMEKYHEAISNAPFMILAKDISVARTKEQKQLLKRQLPIVCWQASFGGKGRKNANAVPSGLYMVDFDDVEDTQLLINKARRRREELDIVYIALSISRKGVRIVAECRPEFSTIAECQRWLSNELGQPCDEACKDWARASYLVPGHYVAYMDEGIFSRGPKCVYQVGAAAPQKTPEIPANPEIQADPEIPENPVKAVNPAKTVQTHYRGHTLTELAVAWLRANGGEPVEGERNQKLYRCAYRLRYICDFCENALVASLPRYGLSEEEIRQIVHSACSAPRSGTTPHDLEDLLDNLENPDNPDNPEEPEEPDNPDNPENPLTSFLDTSVMPPLPPVFRQYADIAPQGFAPAAVLCLLPILGTLGSTLRARYLDGNMVSPSFLVCLDAEQGTGKSFIRNLSRDCLKQIAAVDALGRSKEEAYNEQLRRSSRTGGKKKDDTLAEPKPMVRLLPATISITKLLKRLDNAQGLHCYTLAEEVDTVRKAQGRSFSNITDLLRNAFDNAEYGQDYASENSFSGIVKVFYNVLYSGTPDAVRMFFNRDNQRNGLLSRFILVNLPDNLYQRPPQWGRMTPLQRQKVDEALTELNQMSVASYTVHGKEGDEICYEAQPELELDMQWLNKRIERWEEAVREKAKDAESAKHAMLYLRPGLVGFRAGMLAWFLYGCKSDSRTKESVTRFATWVAASMLNTLVAYADQIESKGRKIKFAEAYAAMPNQFDINQLREALIATGNNSRAADVAYRWQQTRLVEKINRGVYHKVKNAA